MTLPSPLRRLNRNVVYKRTMAPMSAVLNVSTWKSIPRDLAIFAVSNNKIALMMTVYISRVRIIIGHVIRL